MVVTQLHFLAKFDLQLKSDVELAGALGRPERAAEVKERQGKSRQGR